MRGISTLVLAMLACLEAYAQAPYFYKGLPYGSDAMYNPLNIILNGSYDIIQLDRYPRTLLKYRYGTATRNVFRHLAGPGGAISRYGFMRFIRNQVFPFDFRKNEAQWWPNYQLHLIGGGMTSVAMREWYEYHNFPAPGVFSIATLTTYHLLNEIVENGESENLNVDAIADIYLFDLGGVLLFSSESVRRFFAHTLNLADWSLQPSLTMPGPTLQNNGQYFSMKWKLPMQERFHLFYYFGMNGLLGVSYRMPDQSAISLGAGMRAQNLYLWEKATNQLGLKLAWNVGLFYDRNNSLLVSLLLSGMEENMANVNIYPGVLSFSSISPGLWCIMNKEGKLHVGVSTQWIPGIGAKLK